MSPCKIWLIFYSFRRVLYDRSCYDANAIGKAVANFKEREDKRMLYKMKKLFKEIRDANQEYYHDLYSHYDRFVR